MSTKAVSSAAYPLLSADKLVRTDGNSGTWQLHFVALQSPINGYIHLSKMSTPCQLNSTREQIVYY